MFCTTPPRSFADLMRIAVELLPSTSASPYIALLSKRTFETPLVVMLPIDSPCPAKKWLLMTEILADAAPDPPTATLSSPSEIQDCVIVALTVPLGSIPSVLRAVYGVMILMSHAVNPVTLLIATWKLGAFL